MKQLGTKRGRRPAKAAAPKPKALCNRKTPASKAKAKAVAKSKTTSTRKKFQAAKAKAIQDAQEHGCVSGASRQSDVHAAESKGSSSDARPARRSRKTMSTNSEPDVKRRATDKANNGGHDHGDHGEVHIPPPHITINHVYSSAYRKALAACPKDTANARAQAKLATALFKDQGVVNDLCGRFASKPRAKNVD